MKHAILTTLILMLLAVPAFGYNPYGSPLQMDVLVNGTPRPQYSHNGRLYLEALRNEDFTIRLRNNSPTRIAVALSVDGLNTIDAKRTTAAKASKWVVDPWETVEIAGWQVSNRTARSFYFTTEQNSYGAALGQTRNLGIISAVVFREISYVRYEPRIMKGAPSPSAESDSAGRAKGQGRESEPAAPAASASNEKARSAGCVPPPRPDTDSFAATGMGDEQDHRVTRVRLNLESTPCQEVNVRYEFRSELIRLGVIPRPPVYPRGRRETASGFTDSSYCPVVR